MAYRDTVLTDTPRQYYEMESSTGTDSGFDNRTATLNGATADVAGIAGTDGWSFDGVNDYASTTLTTLSNAFSFEAWVKTNVAGSTDTHTVIRRDGTDIVLLRVRGSSIGVNPGQAEVYIDGTTLLSTSSYRVDDGNWHHIVYTQSGNAAKLYIDGTQRATATTTQSTFNFGVGGTTYIGSAAGTSEFYKGVLDEVAVYNTALSAARVTAHYNAGISVTTVDVSTATASLLANDVTVEGNAEAFEITANRSQADAVSMTSTNILYGGAAAYFYDFTLPTPQTGYVLEEAKLRIYSSDASAGSTVTVRAITAEWSDGATNQTTSAGSVTGVTLANGTMEFDVESLMTDPLYGFKMTVAGSDFSTPGHLRSVVSERPELFLYYAEVPPVNVEVNVDTPTASLDIDEPTVEINNPVNVEVILDTVSLSITGLDETVNTGVSTNLDSATASLQTQDVTVESEVTPNAIVDVDTVTLSLAAPVVEVGISHAVDVDNTDTVLMGAYDPTIELTQGVIIDLDTPRIDVTRIPLTDVNGEPVLPSETDDRYFNATLDTFVGVTRASSGGLSGVGLETAINAPSQVWFRMNEAAITGSRVYDRMYKTDANGEILERDYMDLSNVTIGLNDGPEGRKHYYFNGDAYAAPNGGGYSTSEAGVEFTFRTNKKNQFIMGNGDAGGNLSAQAPDEWQLWMVDGRLEVRIQGWQRGFQTDVRLPLVKYTAFTDFADGEWHHVVLQGGYESWTERDSRPMAGDWGLELHVDSRLELRRRLPAQGVTGLPDFIGGRPSTFYPSGLRASEELSRTFWFVGDMTEVVYRYGRVMSEDEIARQRDTMMGIFPVYGDSPKITVKADDAVVKGNKPRMLVLNFGAPFNILDRRVSFSVEPQADNVFGTGNAAPSKVDLVFVGLGEDTTHYRMAQKDKWPDRDYLKFTHYVTSPTTGTGNLRKDIVTDNYRLIDLDLDLNMDDFDVIAISAYPGDESQMGPYNIIDANNAHPMVPVRKQLEGLLAQIEEQVAVHGKGLFVSDPFSAIAMGIIDQVDVVPEASEYAGMYGVGDNRLGAINPGFDAHALLTDPFGGPGGDFPVGTNDTLVNRTKAARYVDTHAIIKQRVRSVVEGLTDIPSWVKTDEIQWWNINPFNEPPYQFSKAYADKTNGLSIGDEFYLDATVFDEDGFLTYEDQLTRKHTGYRVAAPMSAIKAGKAVTSYTPNHYIKWNESYSHGYGDHAVAIAIEPGDSWNGRTVQGKVYVNFTESLQFMAEQTKIEPIMAWKHMFPELSDAESIKIGDVIRYKNGLSLTITEDMAKYQFSSHYGTYVGSEIQLPETGGTGPDWGWSAGGIRGSGGGAGASFALEWSWFPKGGFKPIWVPTMSERALKWLASSVDLAGNASVNTETAEVTANANDVTVETSTNVAVDLSTARVNVESYVDADTVVSDVTVLAITPSTLLQASGITDAVELSTATVTVRTNEIEYELESIDWSETVVLTLPRQIITLTLEDN